MRNALFQSCVIEFLLSAFGILDFQCTGNFLSFRLTSVITIPFSWIIFLSRNLSGSTSIVYLIFQWLLLSSWKRLSGWSFILYIYNIINKSLIELWFGWFNYISLFGHVDIGKHCWGWSSHETSIYLFVKFWIEYKSILCCWLKQ